MHLVAINRRGDEGGHGSNSEAGIKSQSVGQALELDVLEVSGQNST